MNNFTMLTVSEEPSVRGRPAPEFNRKALGIRPASDGRPWLQRKSSCACGGGCPACAEEMPARSIQTKLTVSTPGDQFEQEADRVSEQVMRMPDSDAQPTETIDIASGSNGGANEVARRKAETGTDPSDQVAGNLLNNIGAGQPMDRGNRAFFERHLGRDFGAVRVHSDAQAASAARQVNARAFTLGHDVVFGAGEYEPQSKRGRGLLAHELTHVAQQAGDATGPIRRALVLEDDSPAPANAPVPLEKPNEAPSCDEVCGNSEDKCVREPSEQCSDDMSKKVMAAWTTAATQLATAIDAMNESPLSAKTLASLKANFNWSPGASPTDLATTVATNLSTAATKMSDNLCIKCLGECPAGGKAQIARARGQNCLGSNCFSICPDFTATDTHVLVHELFHRVVSSVQDLYRGQSGYPPPPSMALKMADCYASLIDDTAAAAAAAAAAKAKPGTQTP